MTAEELSFPIYLTLKVCGFSFVLFLLLGTSLAFWFARSRHSIVKSRGILSDASVGFSAHCAWLSASFSARYTKSVRWVLQ